MIEPLLCSFCLAVEDARTIFSARSRSDEFTEGPATGPANIIRWYESLDPVALKWIEYAASTHVLVPVAIFQGTPVCAAHLWEVVQRFWRTR